LKPGTACLGVGAPDHDNAQPDNERIKRRYFAYLKEAKRHSEPTVDAVAKALAHVTRFFQWLAWQPGYKSPLQYSDADYFNLSEKDVRVEALTASKVVSLRAA